MVVATTAIITILSMYAFLCSCRTGTEEKDLFDDNLWVNALKAHVKCVLLSFQRPTEQKQ